MGLISMYRDFSRKKVVAEMLYNQLRRVRPGGIDISRHDDAEGVAALMHLLKHKPELIVVKNKKGATLMFKQDSERVFDRTSHVLMTKSGLFAEPNEDLFNGE